MKLQKFLADGFERGVLTTLCFMSLLQDWYGKDEWLARLANGHWINPWYSVPLTLLILLYCAASSVYEDKNR